MYQLQRPNAILHQLKYLNLQIKFNVRITLPRLEQNANYNATVQIPGR